MKRQTERRPASTSHRAVQGLLLNDFDGGGGGGGEEEGALKAPVKKAPNGLRRRGMRDSGSEFVFHL